MTYDLDVTDAQWQLGIQPDFHLPCRPTPTVADMRKIGVHRRVIDWLLDQPPDLSVVLAEFCRRASAALERWRSSSKPSTGRSRSRRMGTRARRRR